MDKIVQIGPLAMATDRLLALLAIWGFLAVAGIIATRLDTRARRAGWIAILAGVLAARIGFILVNLDAFMVEPWTMLAIWQGGFSVLPGIAAAAVAIMVTMGRNPSAIALMATLGVLTLLHAGATSLEQQTRPMPQLALADLRGDEVHLGRAGRPMVINLWATWCPPCRREMPMLIDVAHNSEIPVLLVNQAEDSATIEAFLTAEGLTGDAVLTDPGGLLGQAIASPALPTTLFVDAHGNIADLHAGEISRAALTAAIRNLQRNP
jgi:thiol-disulfide isomerase/thioredoxin